MNLVFKKFYKFFFVSVKILFLGGLEIAWNIEKIEKKKVKIFIQNGRHGGHLGFWTGSKKYTEMSRTNPNAHTKFQENQTNPCPVIASQRFGSFSRCGGHFESKMAAETFLLLTFYIRYPQKCSATSIKERLSYKPLKSGGEKNKNKKSTNTIKSF